MRRRRRVLGVALVAMLASTSGCAQGGRAAGMADDLARSTRLTSDEVLRLAGPEADAAGTSTDELLGSWASTLRGATGRYLEVPAAQRAVACDAVASVLADSLDGDPATDPNPLLAAAAAVAGANPTVGARALAADLSEAAARIDRGQPSALALLVLRTGVCQAAGG